MHLYVLIAENIISILTLSGQHYFRYRKARGGDGDEIDPPSILLKIGKWKTLYAQSHMLHNIFLFFFPFCTECFKIAVRGVNYIIGAKNP